MHLRRCRSQISDRSDVTRSVCAKNTGSSSAKICFPDSVSPSLTQSSSRLAPRTRSACHAR
eukprot:6022423-Prymnesium_polylepis.1